jgi:hypothetical protein
MNDGTAKIIQFSGFARPVRKPTGMPISVEVSEQTELTPRDIRRAERQAAPPATETAKNSRLRDARKTAWYMADRTRDYWRARLDWQSALALAQRNEIGDSGSFPPARERETRGELCEKWNAAIVNQMLTPAPTLAAVAWKRAAFKAGDHRHTDVNPKRIERAIADDEEFLRAHPVRQSKRGSGVTNG